MRHLAKPPLACAAALLTSCATAVATSPAPAAFEPVVTSDADAGRYVAPAIGHFGDITVWSETTRAQGVPAEQPYFLTAYRR